MHYLIYKITNNINGKIYIGQHQTEDLNDDYMGSGKGIRRAIKKYGIENFTKKILFYCTDWKTMNRVEEVIVDDEFVRRKDTYNMKTGGSCGIYHHTEETKQKMSQSRLGHETSDKTRKKLSEAHKGKRHSEEHRKHNSEAQLGKVMSDESKMKISQALTGRKAPPRTLEWRKHHSEMLKGRHPSEETKQKLSASHKGINTWMKGRKLSDETKLKMSQSRKGHPVSEETKRKISEARRKRLSESVKQ